MPKFNDLCAFSEDFEIGVDGMIRNMTLYISESSPRMMPEKLTEKINDQKQEMAFIDFRAGLNGYWLRGVHSIFEEKVLNRYPASFRHVGRWPTVPQTTLSLFQGIGWSAVASLCRIRGKEINKNGTYPMGK